MVPKAYSSALDFALTNGLSVWYMISYLNADEPYFPLLFSAMPAWNYKQIILSVYVQGTLLSPFLPHCIVLQ